MNIGDIVQLKSGGPDMTVERMDTVLDRTEVDCTWMAEGELKEGRFNEKTLVPAKPKKPLGETEIASR
jgi:uncharacterized protein YodC (DUF2158 family)